jgi:hypothetical protein
MARRRHTAIPRLPTGSINRKSAPAARIVHIRHMPQARPEAPDPPTPLLLAVRIMDVRHTTVCERMRMQTPRRGWPH